VRPARSLPGALGVIEEGALTELILVNGNPLEDIDIVANPDENFDIIMKDRKIYKNMLLAINTRS
jgi:imidazolonepropionase-like amidohydrolase